MSADVWYAKHEKENLQYASVNCHLSPKSHRIVIASHKKGIIIKKVGRKKHDSPEHNTPRDTWAVRVGHREEFRSEWERCAINHPTAQVRLEKSGKKTPALKASTTKGALAEVSVSSVSAHQSRPMSRTIFEDPEKPSL